MTDTYCKEVDLLLTEDISASPTDKPKYVQIAQDEMDGKLGFIYVVPIDISDTSAMPDNQKQLLKSIAAKLATGRLIMGMALGGQGESVNAYALYLIKEAQNDLMGIANGNIDLRAPRVDQSGQEIGLLDDPSLGDQFARVPTAYNPDSQSAVAVFETKYMGVIGVVPIVWNPNDAAVEPRG